MKHLFSSKKNFIRMLSLPGVPLLIAGWQKILEGEKKDQGGECFESKDINVFSEKSYILYISVLDLLRWEARRRRWRLPRLWMEQNSSEGRLVDFLVTTTWWYNAVDWQRMGFAHQIFLNNYLAFQCTTHGWIQSSYWQRVHAVRAMNALYCICLSLKFSCK